MDARSVLNMHISALLQELKRVESTLKDMKVERKLREAVLSNFSAIFARHRSELLTMQRDIKKAAVLNFYWGSLQSRRESCKALFNECLSFMGGALIRHAELDHDICQIADVMIEQLMAFATIKYPRFTLLANDNYYTETTTIIRLNFPEHSVWNLPMAAHELGHYAARRISDEAGNFLFEKRLLKLEEEKKERERDHLHEHIADLFAVYTLGPAYASAALFHRFSPLDDTATTDGDKHPSHLARLRFILKTLEMMNETSDRMYTKLLDDIKALWLEIWSGAGVKVSPEPDQQLSDLQLALYKKLDDELSPAKYLGWPRAEQLESMLLSKKPAEQLLEGDETIADVINAAWLWRVRQDEDGFSRLADVSEKALEMCRCIKDRFQMKIRKQRTGAGD